MRRAVVLAVFLALTLNGVALADRPLASVTGDYTYTFASPWPALAGSSRHVSLMAVGGAQAAGAWSFSIYDPAGNYVGGWSGRVTCLQVDGPDAWIAGPVTHGTVAQLPVAAFLWVHDGGLPNGAGDTAITWSTDPGETLADMVTLCQDKAVEFNQAAQSAMGINYDPDLAALDWGRVPVTSGNLTVSPGG